jgi:uroporphyrinogen-III synthase
VPRGLVVAEASPSNSKVVVTREHGKNGKLMKALEKRGIQCLELPLIEHRDGPDLPRLVQTIREVKFEWIIVTSPEAATVFLRAWREAGCPKVRISVVGAGTGELFQNVSDLIEVAFTPSKATAKVLASELPKIGDGENHVLYPASLKAGDDLATGLTERGFRVLRMNTYSTETVRNLDEAAIAAAAAAPVATFASPTAVRAWMELVAEPRNWDGAAACIGSTSANAASKAGLQKIYHPESPGIEGWVESIMEALEAQKLEVNAL